MFDFNKIIPIPEELNQIQSVNTLKEDIALLCREAIEGDLTEEETKSLDGKIFDTDVTHRENAKKAFHCVVKYKEWLKSLGIEGDWEGIGHCILGYVDGEEPKAPPRKANRVYWVD